MSARAFSAKKRFDPVRLMQVLISSQVSERHVRGRKNNQVIFRVMPSATKPEIKPQLN